jgi:uncharacterized membrane protein
MSARRSAAEAELRPTNQRIEAFSDAVFAIVVTIMVIEIHIPESLALKNDPAALEHFAALLATYALTFVVLGIFWASHHYLIFTLPKADRATLWLNSHLLFWITLIPIVTRFFGMHPASPRAASAYAFIILMCTAAMSLLRAHASRISQSEFHRALHGRVFRKAWIAIMLYAATIPLAFVDIRLAWVLLAILPALFFLPVVRRSMEPGEEFVLDVAEG